MTMRDREFGLESPLLGVVVALAAASSCFAAEKGFMLNDRETIVFLGDSVTEAGTSTEGYITLFKLACDVTGHRVKVINSGISGHKSNDMLARLQKDVIDHHPNWVSISCGDNIGLAIDSVDSYQGDYNIFRNDDPGRAVIVWDHEPEFSVSMIAAGDWATYSGQDQHSLVSTDPDTQLFEDLGNWDFHLREGSIAINKGTADGAPPEDYDGVSRPQGAGFDIGAYERK